MNLCAWLHKHFIWSQSFKYWGGVLCREKMMFWFSPAQRCFENAIQCSVVVRGWWNTRTQHQCWHLNLRKSISYIFDGRNFVYNKMGIARSSSTWIRHRWSKEFNSAAQNRVLPTPFYRATLCVSTVLVVDPCLSVCQSVCPSVTLVYCIKTAKGIDRLLSRSGTSFI